MKTMTAAESKKLIKKVISQGYVYFRDKIVKNGKIYKGWLFSYHKSFNTKGLMSYESIDVIYGLEYCYNFKDNIKVYDVDLKQIENRYNNELNKGAYHISYITTELYFEKSEQIVFEWALTKEELE